MVLKTSPATLAANSPRPGFEPMESDVGTTTPAANTAPANPVAATPVTQAPAAPAANEPPPWATETVEDVAATNEAPATSPAANHAVATVRAPSQFAAEVNAMRGACDFSYGNYTVYKGNNGEIVSKDQPSLGRWAKVTMIGWDDRFEISPGSKAVAAKDAVAYSKDGISIDNCIGEEFSTEWNGRPVAEYLQFLRGTMEYRTAEKRRFIDIGCVIHECESAPEMAGEILQISLSQSSIPSFSSYQEKLAGKALAVSKGIPGILVPKDPFTFYFLREAANKGDNSWTKLKVMDKLPTKI